MATGMAIMGFGGGAMIATPIKETLLGIFYKAPQYLGAEGAVNLVTEGGKRMAEVNGHMVEVVVASAKQLASAPVPLQEGVYVAGTGNTGAAMTFFTLGIGYFIVMMIASFSYRVPREGWVPAGWTPPTAEAASRKMITQNDVHIDQALRTPQFYLLWIVLCFNVTAGIGVIGVAKTMMTEIFGTTLPLIVNSSFAATYVFMISVFNMVGRFFWASTSDFIGRKNTYHIFFVLGIVLYLSIPYAAQQVSVNPVVTWLVMFYAATMIIFTMYGGGFATIPAYLADIFGTKYVGGIHGRLLTAWSTAGVLGPLAITRLRGVSVGNSIRDLAAKVDPAGVPGKVRRRHGSARPAGCGEDRHHRPTDGDRAGRHGRSDVEPVQHDDVCDGGAAGDRSCRELAGPSGARKAPYWKRPSVRRLPSSDNRSGASRPGAGCTGWIAMTIADSDRRCLFCAARASFRSTPGAPYAR